MFQHHAEQAVHQSGICARAVDGLVGDDANVAFADDLHELHHRVTLRADHFHADTVGFGLGPAEGADGLIRRSPA